jgi:hypothetical protein
MLSVNRCAEILINLSNAMINDVNRKYRECLAKLLKYCANGPNPQLTVVISYS